jgi:4-amino-4-deoxy-L-arabinose transferase-like glycosyltransferase
LENRTWPGSAPAAALAVLFLALSLFVASRSTLWDRDEPRFARASSEMAASRNYLVPTFGGAVRPDKPILVYWLQCLSIRTFGKSEVAIRFWSAAAAAGAGLATRAIGRTLFTPAAGTRAMAILLTSPLLLLEAGAATADALLLLFTAAAMLAVARVLRGPARARDFLLFSAAVALGLLTKGPVGLAIPLLSAGAILAFGRSEVPSRGRLAGVLLLASAASFAVFLAWFLPADRAAGGLLWKEGFGRHVVGRMLHPMEGHGGPPLLTLPYYLPVILLGFSPWLLYLPIAIRDLAAGDLGGARGRIFLAAWLLPNLLLFSLVATKLPHYVLPVFPALALAVAAEIEAAAAKSSAESDRDRAWLRGGAWLFGTIAVAETACLVAAVFRMPPPLRASAGALGAVVAASSAAALFFFRRRLPSKAAGAAFAGVVCAQIVIGAAVLPALEPYKPVPIVARAVRARFPAGVDVATFGFAEPSLDFYIGGPPIRRLASAEAILRWSAERGPGVLVTTREDLARIPSAARVGLAELASRGGLNYARGRWIELVALTRPGSSERADR